MTTLPARSRDYLGPVTDTRIWDSFALREGDIVLSTPPKCGTTWTQSMLMMLIHGKAITDRQVWLDSLWLDFAPTDQQARARDIDAQNHRRCIKSHSPFDSISYDPKVDYIAVYRHPIDMHFSMMKHIENWDQNFLNHINPPEPGAAFARFLNDTEIDQGCDSMSLTSTLNHYRSFTKHADCPNVHLFHYADLTRDHAGYIRRFAEILGMSPDDDLIEAIRAGTTFSGMKDTAARNPLDSDDLRFTGKAEFFASGTSHKWEGRLTQAELAAYRARQAELATPQEIVFLEDGHQG